MDKGVVVHIHNEISLTHKKDVFELVLMSWMNLEPITWSEISQKEEDKCHILMYIYMESRKNGTGNLFAKQE